MTAATPNNATSKIEITAALEVNTSESLMQNGSR
jgi:hypothetical protein